MTDKLFSTTEADEFNLVRHNKTDFANFRKFQDKIDARYEKIEAARTERECTANVRKWDSQLPPRWAGADLAKIKNEAAATAERMIANDGFTSFFIRGGSGVGKTYLSYAIVRRFISLGFVTPSQVKVITEESILATAKNGYQGHNLFVKLMDPIFKIYIFENVGTRNSYNDREAPLWDQLMEHVYTNSLAAIFTSTGSARIFSEKLSTQTSTKFGTLVSGKIITMKSANPSIQLDDLTDEELEEEGIMSKLNGNVGLFDDH
jgi:hypothetical protein